MPGKRLVGIKELAEFLGVSIDTARDWVSTNRIPNVKRGGFMKFDLEEIENWIRNRKAAIYNLQQHDEHYEKGGKG